MCLGHPHQRRKGTSGTPPVEKKGERRRSAAPRSRSRDAPEHRRSSTATRGRPSALRAALGPPRAASQLDTGGASQRDASRGSRPVSAGGAQRRLMEVEPQRHASTEVPEPAELPLRNVEEVDPGQVSSSGARRLVREYVVREFEENTSWGPLLPPPPPPRAPSPVS